MNEKDIEKIWNEYYPKVYGFFFRRVNNRQDVEDLTSVSMSIFLDRIQHHDIENPPAYAWKIAQLQLLTFIRSKPRNNFYTLLHEDPEEIDEIDNIRSDFIDHRVSALLECVKKNASQIEYIIIERIIGDDEKAVHVAKELQLTPETVRQKMHRILKKLRTKCISIWNE